MDQSLVVAIVVFGGIALIAFIVTLAMTIRRYRSLPAIVPDHFGVSGEPNRYGPRPMAFVLNAGSLIVLVAWALTVEKAIDSEPHRLMPIVVFGTVADALLIIFFYLQRGILNVASGRVAKMDVFRFWRN